MKLGLNINAQTEAQGASEHLTGILRQAAMAEDAGFDLLSVGQHFLPEPLGMFQPVPLLSALASRTTSVRLLSGIILGALVNPVRLAEEIATLDQVSNGRIVVGLGLGYREVEYRAFGLTDKQVRLRRFLANLEVTTRLLAGEVVDDVTDFWELNEARLTLPPVQVPRPEVWMAANNDKMVKTAAERADKWLMNPHALVSTLARQQALFRTARADAGLPQVPLPVLREVCVAQTSARATEIAERSLGKKYDLYVQWGQDKAQPKDDPLDIPIRELVRDRFIVGDPDECAQQLQELQEAIDTDCVIVRFDWVPGEQQQAVDAIRLFERYVIPQITGTSSK